MKTGLGEASWGGERQMGVIIGIQIKEDPGKAGGRRNSRIHVSMSVHGDYVENEGYSSKTECVGFKMQSW